MTKIVKIIVNKIKFTKVKLRISPGIGALTYVTLLNSLC